MTREPNNPNPLDEATSRRLAKLGQRPVDTSRLDAKIHAALSDALHVNTTQSDATPPAQYHRVRHWLRPVAGLAAALALAVTLFFALNTNTPQVSAAVLELSQLHSDLIAGRIELKTVTTIAEANQWIAEQRTSAPDLPGHIDGARVQSCCLANVQGELVAVAVLKDGDTTVTLVVAQAPNFAMEIGTRVEINGKSFFGHELDGVHMMMANEDDHWLCVMGDRSYEDLAGIAAGIEF